MNRSTPGLPVHHQLPEFTQTHVHPVSDDLLKSKEGLPWWPSGEDFLPIAGGAGSIPGQGAEIPQASQPKKKKNSQNIKQKQYCNKFNQDFKNGPHKKKKKENLKKSKRVL